MKLKNIVILILGLVTSLSVSASPVNWVVDAELTPLLQSVASERLVGSFTYDTDTLSLTNINLSIVDIGSGFDLFSYGFARPRAGFDVVDFFVSDPLTSNLSGESWVALGFNLGGLANYSNSLGTFPITSFLSDPTYVVQSSRQECISADCFTSTGVFTVATSGTLTGSVVPIPAAVWLFGTALLALVGFNKHRKIA